jgi:Na+-driven multidrug efflux pump
MEYVLMFQAIAASYDIPSSAMRGFGHSLEPALLTIFGTCVIRLLWVFFITPIWPGFENLMLCYPITWVITGILVSTVFVLTIRKLERQT